MRKEIGRITFPGNPWPKGHAIRQFSWTGRFEPESGIWFDFDLESAEYYASDSKQESEADEPDDIDGWRSRVLWYNFGTCHLSSTKWAEDNPEAERGVLVGTKRRKLDLGESRRIKCDADLSDPEDYPRPFAIYLLGHDAVAGHVITIEPGLEHGQCSIRWTAKIALIYGELHAEFDRPMKAVIPSARFEGVRCPDGMSAAEAIPAAAPFLRSPDDWVARRRKDGRIWLSARRSK